LGLCLIWRYPQPMRARIAKVLAMYLQASRTAQNIWFAREAGAANVWPDDRLREESRAGIH